MPIKVNDAIEITVIVAEEDYDHHLFEWSDLPPSTHATILRDVYSDEGNARLVFTQRWIIRADENEHQCLQASLNELMGRTWVVTG